MSSVALQGLCQVYENNPDDVKVMSLWLFQLDLGDTLIFNRAQMGGVEFERRLFIRLEAEICRITFNAHNAPG